VFWDPYVKSRPRGRSAARAPARAQVMQRAHAAAAAATARARNATEHRAGGYNQGAFPGSLPVLNRTVNGTSSVIVGNGTFPASQQTTLHQARVCCLEIVYRVPYPVPACPDAACPSQLLPLLCLEVLCSAAHVHFSVAWFCALAAAKCAHDPCRRALASASATLPVSGAAPRQARLCPSRRISPQALCELQSALV